MDIEGNATTVRARLVPQLGGALFLVAALTAGTLYRADAKRTLRADRRRLRRHSRQRRQGPPAPRASGSSASRRSATNNSGPTRSDCTRSFRRAWTRRPRCKVGLKVDADVLPRRHPREGRPEESGHDGHAAQAERRGRTSGHRRRQQSASRGWASRARSAIRRSTTRSCAGIGRRMDGWPNRDLNVGAIIALSPALPADKKAVYTSWGPGKYDPRYNLDGKSTPLVLPPAYGLADVKNETYTAEGPISYWNAYVAVTQMHGQGNFSDPRLGIDVKHSPDMVTPKLPALRAYQHSLPTPPPPAGAFDAAAAERGRAVFDRTCASCHVGGTGHRQQRRRAARARRDRRGRRVRGAHRQQGVSDHAAARALAAPAVLPRRQRRDARRRRRALHARAQAWPDSGSATRPGRVLEVALVEGHSGMTSR